MELILASPLLQIASAQGAVNIITIFLSGISVAFVIIIFAVNRRDKKENDMSSYAKIVYVDKQDDAIKDQLNDVKERNDKEHREIQERLYCTINEINSNVKRLIDLHLKA